MPNKMERFTQRARRVLALAQEAAEQFQHNTIGPEHLLIGLMKEEGGVAARALRDLGLDVRRLEEVIERMTPSGQRAPDSKLDVSVQAKKMIERAVDEARRMGHRYIGTEHLLLGLTLDKNMAVSALERLNISPEEVRSQTHRILQETPAQRPVPEGAPIESAAWPQETGRSPGEWRDLLLSAQAQAKRLRHRQVGPEHLLLAFLLDDVNRCGHWLRQAGVHPESVLQMVGAQPAETEQVEGEIDFSPALIHALGLAVEDAFPARSAYFRSEYLLLGLLGQPESRAIDILKQLGVSPEDVEKIVHDALK